MPRPRPHFGRARINQPVRHGVAPRRRAPRSSLNGADTRAFAAGARLLARTAACPASCAGRIACRDIEMGASRNTFANFGSVSRARGLAAWARVGVVRAGYSWSLARRAPSTCQRRGSHHDSVCSHPVSTRICTKLGRFTESPALPISLADAEPTRRSAQRFGHPAKHLIEWSLSMRSKGGTPPNHLLPALS